MKRAFSFLTNVVNPGDDSRSLAKNGASREFKKSNRSVEHMISRLAPSSAAPQVAADAASSVEAFNSATSGVTIANSTSNSTMIVTDSAGLKLLSLKDMFTKVGGFLADVFMIFGGAIPYVFQYAEIYQRKSALGFSLYVCLALCVANILRILFWFGKHFKITLLVQSIVMLICMFLMLEISVRMNRKLVNKSQRTSILNGHFISDFWQWSDLKSYAIALALFTAVASAITAACIGFQWYVEALGLVALLVEAMLGVPQMMRNFQRKSTTGMSVKMVLMWLIGDLAKTAYFVIHREPAQFWICAILQITIDIIILLQVVVYGRRSRSPSIPYSVSVSSAKELNAEP
ncbi:hypothetical protein QR680_008792 [Steinernema hermaphroditum]|uniref:Solute carrier family 66 member 2 n=1 Tax=Steinernema hermaphroditum TaxID=289476 RepID=A0AA39IHX9_9BILA|nr:hypothetical protein QR680_008792 [Steinernema hermaphroditum]